MHLADAAIVVSNPEVSSVRDSDRMLSMLISQTKRAIDGKAPITDHLRITLANPPLLTTTRGCARRRQGTPH